jgi:excisionase family DNA binding protein
LDSGKKWQFWQICSMKKSLLESLEYPVVIKKVLGDIVISVPDLGHWDSLKLPDENSANSANDNFEENLLKKIKQVLVYIENHKLQKKWVPSPSTFRQSLQKPENEDFTLPEFVKALSPHMSVSENTIRREIKKGKLKCYVTEGGHRRIPFSELEFYLSQAKAQNREPFI